MSGHDLFYFDIDFWPFDYWSANYWPGDSVEIMIITALTNQPLQIIVDGIDENLSITDVPAAGGILVMQKGEELTIEASRLDTSQIENYFKRKFIHKYLSIRSRG